jgi:ATP-dependent Clp protease protease subunit
LVPIVLEQSKYGERSYDLFSRMMQDRIVFVNGQIDENVSHLVTAQLLYLDHASPGAPIQMFINSPGGSVDAGRAIADIVSYIESPVMKIGLGHCASMGQYLLTQKTVKRGEGRYVLPHCRFMQHQPLTGVGGQTTDIIIQNRQVQLMKEQFIKNFVEWTGLEETVVRKDMERDYWMYPEEALERGYIDGILTKKQATEEMKIDLSGVRQWN